MGATSTATTAFSSFASIFAPGTLVHPLHLAENLEGGLPQLLGGQFLLTDGHHHHGPNGLLDAWNHSKKQRPQNPPALVAVNGVTVFLFRQKAETTKTVRALYPTHGQ